MAKTLRNVALLSMAAGASANTMNADGMTCGDMKALFQKEECCGQPMKVLSEQPPALPCPYNFDKPACDDAEPQSPRDLSSAATGEMTPKAAVLTAAQAEALPLVNVHFHLGAEHKSDSYNDDTDIKAFNARRLEGRQLGGGNPPPGYMCPAPTEAEKAAYEFKYCKDVEAGKTYEVHYVHSSAGYTENMKEQFDVDGMDDGLGGAANGRGLLNPMVVVQGQVYQVVNGGEEYDDMLHGWTVINHSNSVMYAGSTTGPSHNNDVCSPFSITWHVDKDCHKISPATFDKMCQQMSEMYGLAADLYPHGSRIILDPKYVVSADYVTPLA